MSIATSGVRVADTVHYEDLLASVHEHFNQAVKNHQHLFVTDATALFDLYINRLPVEQRQHHRCHACRRFVQQYGNVVTISEDGKVNPILWDAAPGFYDQAHLAVRRKVQRANVVGVFYNRERTWGTPTAGGWEHLSVVPPKRFVFNPVLKNAGQVMADKKEDYLILLRSLADFNAATVDRAVTILKSDALYRSEKCLGVAEWLQELHEQLDGQSERVRHNLVWRAVAAAPAGFCHVRSSMIGTLLEDLTEGLDMRSIKKRFAEKMNPLKYQRPQAPPKTGNVVRANRIVEQLDASGALKRRFATLRDIQRFEWQPSNRPVRHKGAGVFSHLLGSTAPKDRVSLPKTTMTWEKFSRTVLRDATKIEALVPSRGPFLALCTAVNMDAPPIVQWDSERRRNPVTWYVYSGGSSASQWNLRGGQYVDVTGITKLPHMWQDESKHRQHGAGIVLLLDGCRDTRNESAALFPELLRSDYHEIRSTIEAHSRSSKLAGSSKATACGLDLRKNGRWDVTLRVTTDKSVATIMLDRWD